VINIEAAAKRRTGNAVAFAFAFAFASAFA
jgi:hypothetical protein